MKKKILVLTSLLFLVFSVDSQTIPTIFDCVGAIPLCDSVYHQTNTIGALGNVTNEINADSSDCLIRELGGVWYKFSPATTDFFLFSIIPDNPNGEDYDWALFNLTGVNCSVLAVNAVPYLISANSAGGSLINPTINQGSTGINGDLTIPGGGNCFGPGPGDGSGNSPADWNTFNENVVVNTGDIYYLYVAQFSGSQGYTIDFRPSQASIISNVDPIISPIDSLCLSGDPVRFSASDGGGVWEGLGIIDAVNGVFDPTVASLGIHEIVYSISSTCTASDTVYVKVLPQLDADFQHSIIEESCTEVTISLKNNSMNATSYSWYKDGIQFSSLENDVVNVLNNSSTSFLLVASNEVCLDTLVELIDVSSTSSLIIPNVLTPNGDGDNDVFRLSDSFNKCAVVIEIYNRWGMVVHESDDFVAWNGRTSSGTKVPAGTYFYNLTVNDIEYKGVITVLY
jgi:gliding motility-associated-like protein